MAMIWGMMTFLIMMMTIKYYLPILSERIKKSDFEALEDSKEGVLAEDYGGKKESLEGNTVYASNLLNSRVMTMILLIACALFSAYCGYQAKIYSVSWIGLLKMTLTMCVLSCVFITDLELLMIPNICVWILFAGRLVTMVVEILWMPDMAISLIVNSIIALVIILVFLMIVSFGTRGGIGMGDIKLFSGIGFLLGVRAVCFCMVLTFFCSALASSVLLIAKRKKLKDSLPLGPFIWLGYGITVLLLI